MRIYPADIYRVPFAGKQGYCARGCRQWAAAQGFDWADFVINGIDAETLLATGDPMARAVVDTAQSVGADCIRPGRVQRAPPLDD
jgi:hypothetical protein